MMTRFDRVFCCPFAGLPLALLIDAKSPAVKGTDRCGCAAKRPGHARPVEIWRRG